MEKYLTLNPARIIPSHGELIENPREAVENAATKLKRREERLLDALKGGSKTFHDLLPELFRNTLQHMFPGAAILASHLGKLRKDGLVEEEDDRYRLKQS